MNNADNCLYTKLPAKLLPEQTNKSQSIKSFLQSELKDHERQELAQNLDYRFFLNKFSLNAIKKPKRIRRKKTFLTRQQRKDLNILKLPKTGWSDETLETMRILWRQYMHDNLDLAKKTAPDCTDAEWANYSTILAKSELVGAVAQVVRSKVPSLVGLEGTIVLETKMVFQIVTNKNQLKTVPKEHSVFEIRVENIKFTIFGKHLLTRPSERSVKKIKSQMLPDL